MPEDDTLPSTASKPPRLGVVESTTAIVFFIALFALRVLAARRVSWNSDEPQHLHMVWAWANGLLPYRDVFDNHAPLFHLLCAPLFRLLGERADIVPVMRLAMVPLFALSLWCVYRIGAALYSHRVGLWAALLTGVTPGFFSMMGQCRTDVLWTTFWLVALAIFTGGPLTRRRAFLTALALGAAFSVSLKTTLFLLTLLAAFAAMQFWRGRLRTFDRQMTLPAAQWLQLTLCLLAGFALIPGLLLAYFAAKGALGQMVYCVITHNVADVRSPQHFIKGFFLNHTALTLIPAFLAPWTTLPLFAREPGRAGRQMFFLLVAGLYFHLLHTFWPVITPQDHVPLYPLLAVVLVAFLTWLGRVLAQRMPLPGASWALPCALGIVALMELERSVIDHGRSEQGRMDTLADLLKLTHPGEFVMDEKGEMIYRPRPYYYVFETFTRRRLSKGLIPDEFAQRLIDTRTAVVHEGERMTETARQFIDENYVSIGRLKVLGQALPPEATDFEVTIPGNYALVHEHSMASGTLDGTPIDGPRELAAGHHTLHCESGSGHVFLVWDRAIQAGYWPVVSRISSASAFQSTSTQRIAARASVKRR